VHQLKPHHIKHSALHIQRAYLALFFFSFFLDKFEQFLWCWMHQVEGSNISLSSKGDQGMSIGLGFRV
jgi:hypothetical protein